MKKEIYNYINDIAKEQGIIVTNSDDLFEKGVLDSLGFIMLLTYLQDSFGMEFGETDMKPENFMSIDAIVEFCGNKDSSCGIK